MPAILDVESRPNDRTDAESLFSRQARDRVALAKRQGAVELVVELRVRVHAEAVADGGHEVARGDRASAGYAPIRSEAPCTWPPRIPPPASNTEKTFGQCSRPPVERSPGRASELGRDHHEGLVELSGDSRSVIRAAKLVEGGDQVVRRASKFSRWLSQA